MMLVLIHSGGFKVVEVFYFYLCVDVGLDLKLN